MYAYQTAMEQTYRHNQAIVRRIAGTPHCEFVEIYSGKWVGLGPLVEVEPVTDPGDEMTARCDRCGATQPVSALGHTVEKYYDWDDPDEDAQGSILHSRTVWSCRTACAATSHAASAEDMYCLGTGQGWSVQS